MQHFLDFLEYQTILSSAEDSNMFSHFLLHSVSVCVLNKLQREQILNLIYHVFGRAAKVRFLHRLILLYSTVHNERHLAEVLWTRKLRRSNDEYIAISNALQSYRSYSKSS